MHTHDQLLRGRPPFRINWKLAAGLAAIPASALIMVLLPPPHSLESQAAPAGAAVASSGGSTGAGSAPVHPPPARTSDHAVVLRPGTQAAVAPSAVPSPAHRSN